MIQLTLAFLITFSIYLSPASAQSSTPELKNSYWKTDFIPTLKSATEKENLYVLAAGLTSAALLKGADETHLSDIQANINLSDDLSNAGDFMGTGVAGLLISGLQYYYDDKTSAKLHVESILYTGASVALLKGILQRTRPNGGNHSMPSGHTSTAFATATSLTLSYGIKAAVIAYPLATLVALQRMDTNAHWPTDVIAGATLGIFWARAVHGKKQYQITPVVLNNNLGLYFSTRF